MQPDAGKKRSNVVMAIVLGLVALAFYVGFIYMTSTAG